MTSASDASRTARLVVIAMAVICVVLNADVGGARAVAGPHADIAGTTAAAPLVADDPDGRPQALSGPVDFTEAKVERTKAGRYVLTVSGQLPSGQVNVQLTPVTYVQQPEHWLIEVSATRGESGKPGAVPFKVSLDVTSTLGTEGIELSGKTKRQQIAVKRGRKR